MWACCRFPRSETARRPHSVESRPEATGWDCGRRARGSRPEAAGLGCGRRAWVAAEGGVPARGRGGVAGRAPGIAAVQRLLDVRATMRIDVTRSAPTWIRTRLASLPGLL